MARIFVLLVIFSEAESGDDRFSVADGGLNHKRGVLVDPSKKYPGHDIVVMIGGDAVDDESWSCRLGLESEQLIEANKFEWRPVRIDPVEIGYPVAVVTGGAVARRDLHASGTQRVLVVGEDYGAIA